MEAFRPTVGSLITGNRIPISSYFTNEAGAFQGPAVPETTCSRSTTPTAAVDRPRLTVPADCA